MASNYLDNSKPSYLGIYFSLFLHLSILLFAIGLPDFFKPKKIPIPQVIPIEIINISDVTSLTPKKESIEIDSKETKKVKQKKFNSSENTEIQKVDLQEKPNKNINKNENISNDSVLTQKSDSKKILLKENKINKLNQDKIVKLEDTKSLKVNKLNQDKIVKLEDTESLKVNKIKPKLKPKPTKKVEPKSDIKPENKINPVIKKNLENKNIDKPKLIEKPQDVEKKNIDKPKLIEKPKPDVLASIMKDLRYEESNNLQEDIKEKKENKISNEDKNDFKDNSELQITLSNLAMQQLQQCVSIDSGQLKGNYQTNGPQFIKTKAKYKMNGEVVENSIQIVDINVSYKIIKMIESRVIFALNTCKLNLPVEHYDLWKSITMTFDVDKILNTKKTNLNLF